MIKIEPLRTTLRVEKRRCRSCGDVPMFWVVVESNDPPKKYDRVSVPLCTPCLMKLHQTIEEIKA